MRKPISTALAIAAAFVALFGVLATTAFAYDPGPNDTSRVHDYDWHTGSA
jgi:hypothetical protein